MTSRYVITSVRFSTDEYYMLQSLAQLLNTSNSEVMRAALRYYYKLVRVQKQQNA